MLHASLPQALMPLNPHRILYEDDVLIAVEKLSGELVVKGKGRVDRLPLLDFLKKSYPGIRALHRLDFETSGIVLFPKSSAVLDAILSKGLSEWKKTYTALVLNVPTEDSGVIDMPLSPRSGRGLVQARTTFRVVERFQGCSLITADIQSGQRHQIRRHLASIGHPLILDDEYGNTKLNAVFTKEFRFQRFFLHASGMEFPHPTTGVAIRITSPLPKHFQEVIRLLREVKRKM